MLDMERSHSLPQRQVYEEKRDVFKTKNWVNSNHKILHNAVKMTLKLQLLAKLCRIKCQSALENAKTNHQKLQQMRQQKSMFDLKVYILQVVQEVGCDSKMYIR